MFRSIVLVTGLTLLLSSLADNAAVFSVSEYDIMYVDSSNSSSTDDYWLDESGMLMCTPKQPFFPDNCNVCTCNEDGTVGFCTLIFCSEETTITSEEPTMVPGNSTMGSNITSM